MKSSIRHGGVLRCDMVTVSETETDIIHSGPCDARFVSYSVPSLVREQAKEAGWDRPKVGRVRWPGQPPMADAKKVDLCPAHTKLVITEEEAKAERKRLRDEFREIAKAAKAKKKAKAANV